MALLENDGSIGNRQENDGPVQNEDAKTVAWRKRRKRRDEGEDEDDDDNVYNITQRCGRASRRCSFSRAGIRDKRDKEQPAP